MALIELKDIGKIYVSGSNVSVGIRGVNLAFDKGEFVAITGQSGSGKSTLLNVISGMDTYEEGEMLVRGEPTSHYVQQDWEEYRKQYISFIFQDYNIIENFTVLQNVELALMHIPGHKERRARAVELLTRVGLRSHLHHKGSKLSGGQKQRTVIARALAKDSPIILADEPTGNLDSQSSKEIIALLREVSKDKLVIIVTHNFDQVKDHATRHVRVFDGAIESDHVISAPQITAESADAPPAAVSSSLKNKASDTCRRYGQNLRNGLTLGRVRFTSMPKLSAFLCMLMIVSALAVLLITSLSGRAFKAFDKQYIFTHIDGRTIITRQDNAVMTDEELQTLAEKTGAQSYMHYDYLLDQRIWFDMQNNNRHFSDRARIAYDEFDKVDIGRPPERENEVLLRVPISYKPDIGFDVQNGFTIKKVFNITDYLVTGIEFYYDNTRDPEIVFTEEGYRTAAAVAYFANSQMNLSVDITVADNGDPRQVRSSRVNSGRFYVSYDIDESSYYIGERNFLDNLAYFEERKATEGEGYEYAVSGNINGILSGYRNNYDHGYYGYESADREEVSVSFPLDDYTTPNVLPSEAENLMLRYNCDLLLSPKIVGDFMYSTYLTRSYKQASLFYADDRQADAKRSELQKLGYFAIPSNADLADISTEAVVNKMLIIPAILIWAAAVIFVTMFVCFCSSRAMRSTKGDIAILRSMGVSTPVIKISIFIQMLIALVPAYIITAVVAVLIFVIPLTNGIFVFLHAGAYAAIASAMLAVAILVAWRHSRKMFKASVKKTLKGDIGA